MKKNLILLLLCLLSYSLFAQVRVIRNDIAITRSLALITKANKVPGIILSLSIDTAALTKQDIQERKMGFPFRFGKSFNLKPLPFSSLFTYIFL